MPCRRIRLLAGIASIVPMALSISEYEFTGAVSAAVAAVALIASATGRPVLSVVALALACGAVLWAAFGTTSGYFRLNRERLESAVRQIEALPAVTSFGIGNEDEMSDGSGRFDSYRSVNGQLVTRHREQVAPEASQPTLREIDVLRDLGVDAGKFGELEAALRRLSLSGFDVGDDGSVNLDERVPGGTPWGTSYRFDRNRRDPSGGNVTDAEPLAPGWHWIRRG